MASYYRPDMNLPPPSSRGMPSSDYPSGRGTFARQPGYSAGYTEFYPSNTLGNGPNWANSYDHYGNVPIHQSATYHGNGDYAATNGNYAPNNYGNHGHASNGYASNGYASNGYASNGDHPMNMGAPIMQPVHANGYHASGSRNPPPWNPPQAQPQYAAQPEEEKPNGGVSAKLDYDSDRMADFLTEMSSGLYELGLSGPRACDIDIFRTMRQPSELDPKYREFVHHMLKATRLPTNTILLGLSYFAHRLRKLSIAGESCAHTDQRTSLVVALILASKHLDDNTFQNKSWTDVTGIPIKTINETEIVWFESFDYVLHLDGDCENGFAQCEDFWVDFKHRLPGQTPLLAPLNTNLPRQPSVTAMSANGYHPDNRYAGSYATPSYAHHNSAYSPWGGSWLGNPSMSYSPPTAPHSGPNTPDYYVDKYAFWASLGRYSRQNSFNTYGLGPNSPLCQAYNPHGKTPAYSPSISSMHSCGGSAYGGFRPQFTTPGFGPIGTH
ncbi:MAG: hypothetical protein M1831_002626 [Alyxoria varia]|nr:MAG: hypothetical protein M1831_002626 [Alyxoria varia]